MVVAIEIRVGFELDGSEVDKVDLGLKIGKLRQFAFVLLMFLFHNSSLISSLKLFLLPQLHVSNPRLCHTYALLLIVY